LFIQNVFAGHIWSADHSLENGFADRMNSFAGRICPRVVVSRPLM